MYTLTDAVRLKEHVLERWEAADKDPSLVEDGALNIVVVGGGPTGVESAGAIAELYRGDFAKDYPSVTQEQRAHRRSSRRGRRSSGCSSRTFATTREKALEKRTVEVITGEVVASVSPTRVTLKSGTEIPAHTLVWGAASRATSSSSRSGSSWSAATGSASGPTSRSRPSRGLRGRRHRRDHGREDGAGPPAARLGRAPVGRARRRDDRPRLAGKEPKPFKYRDKGTMATIGRGAAVVQMLGGRTMKGLKAQVAWGTVHLALLPTNEDRANAVVDWAGSWAHAPARRPDHRRRRTTHDARSASSPPQRAGAADWVGRRRSAATWSSSDVGDRRPRRTR